MTISKNTPNAAETEAKDKAAEQQREQAAEARPEPASDISTPAETDHAAFGLPPFDPFDAPFDAPLETPAQAAEARPEPASDISSPAETDHATFGMPPFEPFDAPVDAPFDAPAQAAEPEAPKAAQDEAAPEAQAPAAPVIEKAAEPEVQAQAAEETDHAAFGMPPFEPFDAPVDAPLETPVQAAEPEAPKAAQGEAAPEAEIAAAPEAEASAEPEAEIAAEPKAEAPVEPKAEVPAEPEAEKAVEPEAEASAEPEAAKDEAEPDAEDVSIPELERTPVAAEAAVLPETPVAPETAKAAAPAPKISMPVVGVAAAAAAVAALAPTAEPAEPAEPEKKQGPKLRALAARVSLPGNKPRRQPQPEEAEHIPAEDAQAPAALAAPSPATPLAALKAGLEDAYRRSGGLQHWVRSLAFWVIAIPVLLSILFVGFWADDMYISEAQMTVRTSKGLSSGDTGGSSGLSLSSMTANMDVFLVYEFIRSTDLMRKLESEIGIRAHYSDRRHDIFTRLKASATDEELLSYYQSVVSVTVDSSTGILKLRVRGYDSAYAHRLAQKIIKHSEDLINKTSERAVRDTMSLAQEVLTQTEGRMLEAQGRLKQFRLKYGDFSPSVAATGTMSLLSGLEEQQAKASAELTMLRSYMREDSPQVISLKSRVEAIARQLASEQQRLTGAGAAGKASLVVEYDSLVQERDFAARALDGARQAMDQARINALSKTRYLEAFVQPNLPEEPTYPERLMFIGVTAIFAFLAWGIISLTWAAIKEHTGF